MVAVRARCRSWNPLRAPLSRLRLATLACLWLPVGGRLSVRDLTEKPVCDRQESMHAWQCWQQGATSSGSDLSWKEKLAAWDRMTECCVKFLLRNAGDVDTGALFENMPARLGPNFDGVIMCPTGRDGHACCGCFAPFFDELIDFSKVLKKVWKNLVVHPIQANRSLAGFRNATRSLPRAVQSIMGSYTHTLHWMRASIDPGLEMRQESHWVKFNELQGHQRSPAKLDFVRRTAALGCIANIYAETCSHPHLPGFLAFPPVQGPAREGQIFDFLGVSTDVSTVCCTAPSSLCRGTELADSLSAGHAIGRWIQCSERKEVAESGGEWYRAWPALDEEYFEWHDILETVALAAARGDGYAMAEIGSGAQAHWAIRAGVAISRLSDAPCRLLTAEPEDLNWTAYTKRRDESMPRDRCNITVHTDYVSDAAALRSVLQGAGFDDQPWDLVDIDAQGAELPMLQGNLEWLARRVRRLHVSSHSRAIHRTLLGWLREADWFVPVEYSYFTTPSVGKLGRFAVLDGHMTAMSPHFPAPAPVLYVGAAAGRL